MSGFAITHCRSAIRDPVNHYACLTLRTASFNLEDDMDLVPWGKWLLGIAPSLWKSARGWASRDRNQRQKIADLEQENLKLRSEKNDLAEKSKIADEWKVIGAQYRIRTTSGGATVMEPIDTSSTHYACQPCFETKNRVILQPVGDSSSTVFFCPRCKTQYQVYPEREEKITIDTKFNPGKP